MVNRNGWELESPIFSSYSTKQQWGPHIFIGWLPSFFSIFSYRDIDEKKDRIHDKFWYFFNTFYIYFHILGNDRIILYHMIS